MKEKFSIVFYSIVLLIFLSLAGNISAQVRDSACCHITIGAGPVQSINQSPLHRYWDPEPGLHFWTEIPVYIGNFQAGLSYMQFEAIKKTRPDFTGILFYFQWEYELNLIDRLKLIPGVRFGLWDMDIEDDDSGINDELLKEREFSTGISAGLFYPLYKDIGAEITVNYFTILTKRRMEITNLSFSLTYSFDTPEWLREVLE